MYKKLGFLLMAVFLFVALFTGCGLIEDAGFPAAETSEETPDRQAAANNAEGADAYRRMDTLGDYHFDPEGRMYYSGEDTVGRWVLTDEKTLGEEKPNGIRITAPSFEYVYKPGDLISDSVWFHAEGEAALDENLIYGSLYFADVSSGDVELDQELTVREYFRNNDGIGFDHVELSHFGWDTDGQSGAYQKDNGDRECHFFVSCNLPRLTAEGDTIYAVLDLKNTEGDLLTRILKGYTFEILDAEVAEKVLEAEAAEEEDGYDYEGDPAYFRMEYPGHWTLTDVHFIGGGEGEVKDGDMTISAERYGAEGEDMVYSFTGSDGSQHRIRIPDPAFEKSYFAQDSNNKYFYITHYMDPEDAPGRVVCSVFLGDVDFEGGEVSVTPRHYFKGLTPSAGEQKLFYAPPDEERKTASRYLDDIYATFVDMNISFPAGEQDGEKLYLVYAVSDDLSGNAKMYNIYEYTYSEGPDEDWIYNDYWEEGVF